MTTAIAVRPAKSADLAGLLALEQQCFSSDRLSKRSFQRFIRLQQAVFVVAELDNDIVGYALVIFHRGTRLARLYSIAVSVAHQGKGIARTLLTQAEQGAEERGALYLRLEVNQHNVGAIHLYRQFGYREFGLLDDYYEDHSSAIRMQKRIRHLPNVANRPAVPWYRQTTEFTCGPSALMMAMAALNDQLRPSLSSELQLWREATTIFMTSGHGGCHPIGLANAAVRRGFTAQVWLSQDGPLFIDSVRDNDKKTVIEQVHNEFCQQASELGVELVYDAITQDQIQQLCLTGAMVVILISTYRLDSKKAPHWVCISGWDEDCFYLHDPDPDEKHQDAVDCQYQPILRRDFDKMSQFGRQRLRTAIVIFPGDR